MFRAAKHAVRVWYRWPLQRAILRVLSFVHALERSLVRLSSIGSANEVNDAEMARSKRHRGHSAKIIVEGRWRYCRDKHPLHNALRRS